MTEMIVVVAYVATQMLADVLSLKIAVVAGFSVDVGTFVYPFTFTLRDLVHKSLGRATARAVVILAALAWCEEHGYTVRRWHGGARAWKGTPWVIRTRSQIWRKREQIERQVAAFARRHPGEPTPNLSFLDFAYDG